MQKLCNLPAVDLEFLSSIFYFITLKCPVKTEYQWCYYGTDDIFFNRISQPFFFSKNNVIDKNKHSLCAEISTQTSSSIFKNPAALQSKIIDDLVAAKVINSAADISNINFLSIENTYPIYKKNYKEELAKLLNDINKFSNIFLLGRCGKFWYNNMDHSIKDAFDTVAAVIAE